MTKKQRYNKIKDLIKLHIALSIDKTSQEKDKISAELAFKLQKMGIGFNDEELLESLFEEASLDFKKETLEELIEQKSNKRLVETGGPTTDNDN